MTKYQQDKMAAKLAAYKAANPDDPNVVKYTIEQLGGLNRKRSIKIERIDGEFMTAQNERAAKQADQVVRDWRENGYKGGAQLVLDGSLIEVYGRDFK